MLNNRLACILGCVPAKARVIDVGCDHAYLAIELVKRGLVTRVIASDIVAGPIAAARKNIQSYALEDKIKVVQASGLAGVEPGEIDCVIIAGMGAGVIIDILTAGKNVLQEGTTLILQPMVAVELLRRWLADNAWQIKTECLVEDNEIIYEVLIAQPAQKKYLLSMREIYLGKLAKQKLFPKYVSQLLAKQERIQAALKKAKSNVTIQEKQLETATIIKILREAQDES